MFTPMSLNDKINTNYEREVVHMGILGKIVGVGAVALGNGVAAIGKSIENGFEKQRKNNMVYMEKYPFKCKFLIREVKHKMDDMKYVEHFGVEDEFFVVYDFDDKPVYITSSGSEKGKCSFAVMDMNRKEVSNINVTASMFNSEKRICQIKWNNELIDISTNNSFDKRSFSVSGNTYRITSNDVGKEIKIYEHNRLIVQMNKLPSDLGMKWGEYVIGFEKESDKMLSITFSIVVGILLIESANLLK